MNSNTVSDRIRKLNHLIQHEIAPLLLQEIDESQFGLITVKKVEVSRDLSIAKIWVSCMLNPEDFEAEANKHVYKIQQALNKHMHSKKVPKIIFKNDNTSEYVAKIENLLEK